LLGLVSLRRAGLILAVILVAFGGVTFPFYFANPQGFTPLTVGGKLGILNDYVPFADTAIYLVTATAALLLATTWAWRSEASFFWSCGIIGTIPLLLGEMVLSLATGTVTFYYLPYLHIAV
jgi:hypothetical protein